MRASPALSTDNGRNWVNVRSRLLQAITGTFVGFAASYGVVSSNRVLLIALSLAAIANAAAWLAQGNPRGWWLTILCGAAVLLSRDAPLVLLPDCATVDPAVRCVVGDARARLVGELLALAIALTGYAGEALLIRNARP